MTIQVLPKYSVKETAERVWSQVQDVSTRCYPLVKSAEEFERTLTWALEDDSGRARSCWMGRDLVGVCCLFIDEEERYAQLIALYAWDRFQLTADAFLNWVDEEYPSYTIDAGIAGENAHMAEALERHGYQIADDCLDLRHPLPAGDCVICEEGDRPERLEARAFDEYATLHDAWFPGLYWNAERLSETKDGWTVLTIKRGGEIAGAILLIYGNGLVEIYGLHAVDAAMARSLLNAALAHYLADAKEARFMLFMAEAADEICVQAALDCGFSQTGRYIGYRKVPLTDQPGRSSACL